MRIIPSGSLGGGCRRVGAAGKSGCKPNFVPVKVVIIPLGIESPQSSGGLPAPPFVARRRRAWAGPALWEPIWPCTAWGLPCLRCHHRSGGLLPHLFNLTRKVALSGGMFSVALSVGSPPLPVRKHAVLWCSDFPPPEHYTRAAITLPTCQPPHSTIHLSFVVLFPLPLPLPFALTSSQHRHDLKQPLIHPLQRQPGKCKMNERKGEGKGKGAAT